MNIYKFKVHVVKNGGTLFYSDTDSIYSSIPLPDNMISSNLGSMKLEYVADRAVFLAPKVYAVQLVDGTTIIKIKGSKNNHGITLITANTIYLP